MCCFVFFFKQKTAYEMRISDWSSDVCSSDLWPTSPTWVLSRNGVEPLVSAVSNGGPPRCALRAGSAQTHDSGIRCARLSVWTMGWRAFAPTWQGRLHSDPPTAFMLPLLNVNPRPLNRVPPLRPFPLTHTPAPP